MIFVFAFSYCRMSFMLIEQIDKIFNLVINISSFAVLLISLNDTKRHRIYSIMICQSTTQMIHILIPHWTKMLRQNRSSSTTEGWPGSLTTRKVCMFIYAKPSNLICGFKSKTKFVNKSGKFESNRQKWVPHFQRQLRTFSWDGFPQNCWRN